MYLWCVSNVPSYVITMCSIGDRWVHSKFNWWAHCDPMMGYILNVFRFYPLGTLWTLCVCESNVSSMYPAGILPLAPSDYQFHSFFNPQGFRTVEWGRMPSSAIGYYASPDMSETLRKWAGVSINRPAINPAIDPPIRHMIQLVDRMCQARPNMVCAHIMWLCPYVYIVCTYADNRHCFFPSYHYVHQDKQALLKVRIE